MNLLLLSTQTERLQYCTILDWKKDHGTSTWIITQSCICLIQWPVAGVPRISGTFWVGTIRLLFPNPRWKTDLQHQQRLSFCVELWGFLIIIHLTVTAIIHTCLIVKNKEELTSPHTEAINIFMKHRYVSRYVIPYCDMDFFAIPIPSSDHL